VPLDVIPDQSDVFLVTSRKAGTSHANRKLNRHFPVTHCCPFDGCG
jgi:hypothetical protein